MFVVTWLGKWSDINITKKDDILVEEIPRIPMSKMVVGPNVCSHNSGGSCYILELSKLYERPHVYGTPENDSKNVFKLLLPLGVHL